MRDTVYRDEVIEICKRWRRKAIKEQNGEGWYMADILLKFMQRMPSADRPKHYCAECKFEPIDKRCMPCSSCTNNPKNRDAFVSCEVEKKGADDESI